MVRKHVLSISFIPLAGNLAWCLLTDVFLESIMKGLK